MKKNKVTIAELLRKKKAGKKITMITAYDYPVARLVDEAGIDVILIGDSLGMVVLGYDSTTPVTMDDMIHHSKAVTRAAKNCLIIGDMPFNSYWTGIKKAVKNAMRFKEAGCDAVKLEGGTEVAKVVAAIIKAGIPVCGHIGLTPQSVTKPNGFKVQGRDAETARLLLKSAKDLESAGAFMIVLECIPDALATRISREIKVPAIGIGAGKDCDGQVLVFHDMVGLFERFTPKFVKRYVDLSSQIRSALSKYKEDVEKRRFPGTEHTYK